MIRPPPISTRTHTPFPYTPRFPSTSRSTRRVAPPPTGSTATIRSNGSRNGWRNRKPGQKVEAFPSPLTDKKGRRAPPFTLAKSRLWQGHGLSLPLPRARRGADPPADPCGRAGACPDQRQGGLGRPSNRQGDRKSGV